MKFITLSFLAMLMVAFTSCQKDSNTKEDFLTDKDSDKVSDVLKVCDWSLAKVADWTKYVIEPVITTDACGCPVKGVVKYVKNDKTAIVVYYGKGECDQWAIMVSYSVNDAGKKVVKKCKFKLDCAPN